MNELDFLNLFLEGRKFYGPGDSCTPFPIESHSFKISDLKSYKIQILSETNAVKWRSWKDFADAANGQGRNLLMVAVFGIHYYFKNYRKLAICDLYFNYADLFLLFFIFYILDISFELLYCNRGTSHLIS